MLQGVKQITIAQPGGGLVTYPNFFALQPNQTPNCMNVKFTIGGTVEKRLGSTTTNSVVLVSSLQTGFNPDTSFLTGAGSGFQIFWNMNDQAGTRTAAFGGAGLVNNNTVASTGGVVGNASQFTAANSMSLSLATTTQVVTGDINFSVPMWIRFHTTMGAFEERVVLSKRDNNRYGVNLNGYWRLDEGSGTRVDATGNGNDLTDNNTVTVNPGRVNSAAQFTRANNEFFTLADNASMSVSGDFCLGIWVYMDSKASDINGIAGKWTSATGEREWNVAYRASTDHFEFYVDDIDSTGQVGVEATTFGSPSTATWYFIFCTWTQATGVATISINNGTVDSATDSTVEVGDSTASFCIGRRAFDEVGLNFDGRMDECGFWKRILTAGEITQLYNSGLGRTHPFIAVGSSDYEYMLMASSGQGAGTNFVWRVSSSGLIHNGEVVASSFGAVTTGQWYHVVPWHDATNNRIGINVNAHVNTAAYISGVRAGSADFVIGALGIGTPTFWDGAVDGTGVWKSVLAADQIVELRNAVSSGSGNEYNISVSNAGWGMFDFGAGFNSGTPLRWFVVAAGTGLLASSNRGVTFVAIATDRRADYQFFERSKSFFICCSNTGDRVLYWAGSVGTFALGMPVGSAPPAKHPLDYAGYLLLMNHSGGVRSVTYSDNRNITTDPWTNTFELPSALDDEITGGVVLNKNAYAFTKFRIFRISHVGGNPDFQVQVLKDIGAVPRTIKKVTYGDLGEVVVFLSYDKKVHIFDGSDEKVISDSIEQDNGVCPVSLSRLETTSLNASFAVLDELEQTYKLWVAITPSTNVTHCFCLNLRSNVWYPYDNQNFNMAIMAESGPFRNLFAVRRDGFVHWVDTTNRDHLTAVNDYYDIPYLYNKSPDTVMKAHKVDLYFSVTSSGTLYYQDNKNWEKDFMPARETISFADTANKVQILKTIDIPQSHNVYAGRITSSSNTANPYKLNRIDYHFSEMGKGSAP